MSYAHASNNPTHVIDNGKIASHLEKSVSELATEESVVEIDVVSADHIERSVFYRDDHRRVYHINPKAHPAITGTLDALFEYIADQHGMSVTRSEPTDAYLISVVETCDECDLEGPIKKDPDDTYYPTKVLEKLTTCPFHEQDLSCNEATADESVCICTAAGEQLTDSESTAAASFSEQPIPENEAHSTHNGDSTVTECTGVTIGQTGVDGILAKIIGVLDVIAYVRTHPSITSGTLDHYPDVIGQPSEDVTQDQFDEFKDYCDEFLLETSPGWRLRWILEVVDDDAKPLKNIAAAANISVVEARLTIQLLEQWGVVARTKDLGENRYQFSTDYLDWRETISETGVENTEPVYLSETGNPIQLIEDSYAILTEPTY